MKGLLSILLVATVVAAPMASAAQDRRGDERRVERNERRSDRGVNQGYGRNGGYDGDYRGRNAPPVPVAPRPRVPVPAPRDIPGRMTADRFAYRGGYARDPGPTARAWSRGQYLPQEYWGARVADPNRFRLRPPPYGYSWVGVGRDIYLMQDSTGLILDSIPGAF